MSNLVVSFPRQDGGQFDAAYYRSTHLPLVEASWSQAGLIGTELLVPADDAQPFESMVVLRFKDSAAIDAALTSPAAQAVMTDVPNFTNIQPNIYRTA